MENEEQLRHFISETLIEEGVLDWLFSRWRKNGKWKGNKYAAKEGKVLGGFVANLEQIYRSIGELHNEHPRKTKLIRGNLLRAIRDIEDLLIAIERGRTERDLEDL